MTIFGDNDQVIAQMLLPFSFFLEVIQGQGESKPPDGPAKGSK